MNEGLNYKVLFGLILMVVVLFFGVSFIVNRMKSSALNSNNSTTTTTTATTTAPTTTTPSGPTDLSNVDLSTYSDKTVSFLAQADKLISSWQAGLGFYNITVDIPADLSIGASKLTYAYGSESNQDYWFTISYSENSSKYVRAILPKEDYLGKNLSPINKSFWKLNYAQAFQLADNFKGKEFRKAGEIASITASLSQSAPKGWLWWVITYTNKAGDVIFVRINASNSDICDEKGEIIISGKSLETTSTPSSTPTTTTTSPTTAK